MERFPDAWKTHIESCRVRSLKYKAFEFGHSRMISHPEVLLVISLGARTLAPIALLRAGFTLGL
jgi:hypothetical protein